MTESVGKLFKKYSLRSKSDPYYFITDHTYLNLCTPVRKEKTIAFLPVLFYSCQILLNDGLKPHNRIIYVLNIILKIIDIQNRR